MAGNMQQNTSTRHKKLDITQLQYSATPPPSSPSPLAFMIENTKHRRTKSGPGQDATNLVELVDNHHNDNEAHGSHEKSIKKKKKKKEPLTEMGLYRTQSGHRLRILSHQVAGQAPLLRLCEGKVCKPLTDNEHRYYEQLNGELASYVSFHPGYYGAIIIYQEDETVADVILHDEGAKEEREQIERLSAFMDNSWEEKLYYKNICENKPTHLILEDLTSKFHAPSILDLKMGSRQHGKCASPEKVRTQIMKCAKTTSASLGYRLCGLKAWQVDTENYVYRDKYYGRNLTTSNISEIFELFFHNGRRFRSELVPMFIKAAQSLLQCLIELKGKYTWLGSSLLFIYEGLESKEESVKFDVRMVDFAKTYKTEEILRDENVTEVDDGYLFGLKNLVSLLSQFIEKTSVCTSRVAVEEDQYVGDTFVTPSSNATLVV